MLGIAESGVKVPVYNIFGRRLFHVIDGRIALEFLTVWLTLPEQRQEGLHEDGEPPGRRLAANYHAVKVDIGLQGNAIYLKDVPENGRRDAPDVVQGQHWADMPAFPFLKVRNLGQTAVKDKGVIEHAGSLNLFVHNANAVGEGPEGAAGNGIRFFLLDTDLGHEEIKAGGVLPMPGIISLGWHCKGVVVSGVIHHKGLCGVQGVLGGKPQGEVILPCEECRSELAEKPGLGFFRDVFPGEKAHPLPGGSKVGAKQEMGYAGIDLVFHFRSLRQKAGTDNLLGVREFLHAHAL